ncbi:peptidase C1B bleomycin hydrolase [Cantharellus anzutake]|uniref:peptidase C1B bleomycin hydrolase n=1 Tax=Cantharellus anzutake TaxID=1750568 RepID=UPI001905AA6D|nr:peptidase C1B bleomycin hydrolase [Cantharellus anzutake]KAF8334243.1 peptidase C1B bleomycin hydrolase [Cantharellus anzutake]
MGASQSTQKVSKAKLNEKHHYQHASDEAIAAAILPLSISPSAQGPVSSDGSISLENLENWEDEASKARDQRLQLSRTILNHTDFKTALLSRKTKIANLHIFNTRLDFHGNTKVTDQKSSGRCWLFATTNVIRYNIAKSLGLEDFQLSQSYLFLYDKLNKANYYLELSIQHVDLPLDDRLIVHLADDPVGDGGQWDMAVNLLENYGLVPQAIFPESYSSSASKRLDQLITTKLREHALLLRKRFAELEGSLGVLDAPTRQQRIQEDLRQRKEQYIGEVYKILTVTLGEPPKPNDRFDWEYYTAHGDYKSWTGTPLEFYKTFSNKRYPHHEAFSLINDPRNEYGKLYTVDKLGNVWNGRPIRYVNTSSQRLREAVVKTIKAGQPVFFGCDVGQSSDQASGVMATGLYDIENAFGVTLGLDKADRLRTGESAMTHAMTITAVHLDDKGTPVRFKVENSWGETAGEHGYFVMTTEWFDEYVYQVVVPKQLAPGDLIKVLDQEPIVLPPWDPLGALA